MRYIHKLKEAAKKIKHDVMTVYFVARDSRTPFLVKILALAIAAYAISPIDLIPDFIPVLGYLDDVILLPLSILLVIKLTPKAIIDESRLRASKVIDKPTSKIAAAIVIGIWIICIVSFSYWLINT